MTRLTLSLSLLVLAACEPTVKLQAPKEPIVIDLNVNIEHNVRVQIDRDLDELIENEEKLF